MQFQLRSFSKKSCSQPRQEMMQTCLLYVSTVINCTWLTVDSGLPLRMGSCGNHFGAKCNFSCTIGYRLNGSSTVTCVAPGNRPPGYWDNPLPSCEGTRKRIYFRSIQVIHFAMLQYVEFCFVMSCHSNCFESTGHKLL